MSTNLNSVQARSLWMGDIESWMNEDFIKNIFKEYGNNKRKLTLLKDVRNVKIIRDKTKPTGTGKNKNRKLKYESIIKAIVSLNSTKSSQPIMLFKTIMEEISLILLSNFLFFLKFF